LMDVKEHQVPFSSEQEIRDFQNLVRA